MVAHQGLSSGNIDGQSGLPMAKGFALGPVVVTWMKLPQGLMNDIYIQSGQAAVKACQRSKRAAKHPK
jgi:hypothetical protein